MNLAKYLAVGKSTTHIATGTVAIYEHLVACSSEKYQVPVVGRYTDEVVKGAGFADANAYSYGMNPQQKRTVIVCHFFNLTALLSSHLLVQ